MTDHPLPGKTKWETQDQCHRIAAIHAFRYLARRVEADPAYPLPENAGDIIALAAAAMEDAPPAGSADAEAYAARRLAAIRDELAVARAS